MDVDEEPANDAISGANSLEYAALFLKKLKQRDLSAVKAKEKA